MSTTIRHLLVSPDGSVEAYYSFTDALGENQSAAMRVAIDGTALIAPALDEVDAALASLGPQTSSPAALVDAVMKAGAAKAAEAVAKANIERKQAQAADLDKQIAEKQAQLAASAETALPVTKP